MRKFKLKSLSQEQKATRLRILDLAYETNRCHLGSCLSCVDLIDTIYKIKKDNEKFVLSNGHAAMALYIILEKYGKIRDSKSIKKLHVHPNRDVSLDIHVSTGSLGQGLPIALGIAIANRKENVYCMVSDGECAEGSVWETLRIMDEQKVNNLKIIVNANGWGAYDPIDLVSLYKRLKAFGCKTIKVNGHDMSAVSKALKRLTNKPLLIFAQTSVEQLPFLKGQDAHYYIMNENDYNLGVKLLK